MSFAPGLVDASDWAYVASAMASRLQLDPIPGRGEFPIAVLDAAEVFFETAVEATASEGAPSDPLTSASNYAIAAEALAESGSGIDLSKLADRLRQYLDLVHKLQLDNTFTSEESGELRQMAQFFRRIASTGERDAYDRFMAMGY